MAVGVSEEHEELHRALRRWTDRHCTSAVVRAYLDDAPEVLPPFWDDLAAQGWLGIHLPVEHGGQGGGVLELAVVLEELGRVLAPGPFLSTALAAAVVGRGGTPEQRDRLLPDLVAGRAPAAVALPTAGQAPLRARRRPDGAYLVEGVLPAVLSAGQAALAVLPVDAGEPTWCVIPIPADGVEVVARRSVDETRRCAELRLDGAVVDPAALLPGPSAGVVEALAMAVVSAELTGSARWCLETAAEHARTRVQFGRPIGQFQGVKHKLADLLCVVEQMTAATWDAALALDEDQGDHEDQGDQWRLSAAGAGSLALDGSVRAARDAIQVLGGMGFTWEHDAHLHLRRATSLRQLVGGPAPLRRSVATQVLAGSRRVLELELPAEADAVRAELEPVVAEVAAAAPADRGRLLGERGLLFPHWPAPWGRDASPVEQLVIDELLAAAKIRRPPAHVSSWALPTLIAHGTAEQQERWVRPTLRGELLWCQLFSEPGAGSDLASLTTRATRGDGGWVVDGQKVWTSVAAQADVGILLARTDPEAPKHEGITYFVVDMATPGIEVRPLREATGDSLFNEVFLEHVFVSDDRVVGPVNGGWRLARTTLANERVSLSSGSVLGSTFESLLEMLGEDRAPDVTADPVLADRLGGLLVEAQSLGVMAQRATLRSVSGLEPGAESSVGKLLGGGHEQRVADFGLELCGPAGVFAEGPAEGWARSMLFTLCFTIAGGTSEVQRNVIGERLLGLPRDPEPTPPARG